METKVKHIGEVTVVKTETGGMTLHVPPPMHQTGLERFIKSKRGKRALKKPKSKRIRKSDKLKNNLTVSNKDIPSKLIPGVTVHAPGSAYAKTIIKKQSSNQTSIMATKKKAAKKTATKKSGEPSLAQKVRDLHTAGKTNEQIVEKLGVTNKYVCDVTWRIYNKVGETKGNTPGMKTRKTKTKPAAKKKAAKKAAAKKAPNKKAKAAPAADAATVNA